MALSIASLVAFETPCLTHCERSLISESKSRTLGSLGPRSVLIEWCCMRACAARRIVARRDPGRIPGITVERDYRG